MSRGPAYPYMNLEAAVELTRKLYEYTKRTPANLGAVVKEKWEYSPTSSTAQKTVAALRYYGLADIAESSDKTETIKITDRAYRILVDSPSSVERKQAIRDACLSPKAYKLCWDLFGAEMPESMRSTLIFDHGFNESTVDGFLTNYRRSVQFAGLLEESVEKTHESDLPAGTVGEKVVPVQSSAPQTTPAPAGIFTPTAPPGKAVLPPKGAGMRQEVFALTEGDVTIQWPEVLSPDSYQDFDDWLAILKRKIKRSVVAPDAARIQAQVSDDDEQHP
jgi:hypothetical protein